MMGPLERGQEQLFYAFNLEDAVPQDHLRPGLQGCAYLAAERASPL